MSILRGMSTLNEQLMQRYAWFGGYSMLLRRIVMHLKELVNPFLDMTHELRTLHQ